MGIFREILDCRSLTVIVYKVEAALEVATDPKDQEALQAILSTNKLDEVYAISHEQLGHLEKAAELRAWIARPRNDKE